MLDNVHCKCATLSNQMSVNTITTDLLSTVTYMTTIFLSPSQGLNMSLLNTSQMLLPLTLGHLCIGAELLV